MAQREGRGRSEGMPEVRSGEHALGTEGIVESSKAAMLDTEGANAAKALTSSREAGRHGSGPHPEERIIPAAFVLKANPSSSQPTPVKSPRVPLARPTATW